MLIAAKVAQALEGQREAFRQAAEQAARHQEAYLAALDTVSYDELSERLADEQWPGARPTSELRDRGLIVSFEQSWETAQEARSWALSRLRGVPTVAIDGSQIAASKEFAVPVSLVQVAWFENWHDPDRPYTKDVRNEVVTADPGAHEAEEYAFAESRLNQRRFALEMQVATDQLGRLPADPPPVVFLDTSFVLSFIGRLVPPAQTAYLAPLLALLAASEEHRIPVVGYVDLSFARDLTTMLRTACGLPAANVFDAQILAPRMRAFDRTAAFECGRADVLPLYGRHQHDLCFVYLKTGADRLPSRIDFPRWILDAGLLDHVLDVVRAEVVVGSGYPYAIETADAAAVLSLDDRMAFYRQFQRFAETAGLPLLSQGKPLSKAHRR